MQKKKPRLTIIKPFWDLGIIVSKLINNIKTNDRFYSYLKSKNQNWLEKTKVLYRTKAKKKALNEFNLLYKILKNFN